MKQILQHLRTGETVVEDVPAPPPAVVPQAPAPKLAVNDAH